MTTVTEALAHPSPTVRALGLAAEAAGGFTPGQQHFVDTLVEAYAERPKRVQARPGITIELVGPVQGRTTVKVCDPWGTTLAETFEDHDRARARANELYQINRQGGTA